MTVPPGVSDLSVGSATWLCLPRPCGRAALRTRCRGPESREARARAARGAQPPFPETAPEGDAGMGSAPPFGGELAPAGRPEARLTFPGPVPSGLSLGEEIEAIWGSATGQTPVRPRSLDAPA